jgi:hypothetical protein
MTTMKIRNTIALTVLILVTSCDLGEVNINPNKPMVAPMGGILSGAQASLVYAYGADYALKTSVFMQQVSGIGGFAVNDDRYNFATSAFDGAWGKIYTNVINELRQLVAMAQERNSPHYEGVAKILSALALGTLTSSYGDIPWTQALDPSILAPSFDSQESVYNEIQQLLSEGINLLNETSVSSPGTDDMIYNGDLNKWKALAWTLKARYALHLSKLNAAEAAQNALNNLYEGGLGGTYRGIASNAGDFDLVFGTANNQASPWYTQNAGRPGWYGMGYFFVALLNGDPDNGVPVDPRRAAFANPMPPPAPPHTYKGAKAGEPEGASNIVGPATYYGRANSPVSVVTFVEARFIEIEARLILDENDPELQPLLEEAVTASFEKVTSPSDPFASPSAQNEYIASRAQLAGDAQEKLETIITQKYIALFLNPEVWTDYRRTGYPALQPATGGSTALNPNGQIPRRFAYPNSEVLQNKNIPTTEANLQEPRLWWDVDN